MSSKVTNRNNIPLPLAVWLAVDDYDYNDDPYTISATTLLKSTRAIVLGSRLSPEQNVPDISDLVASRMGTALHDSVERTWVSNYKKGMGALGLPAKAIDKVVVNPTEPVKEGQIPIYFEKRCYKKYGKWTVSGKFDMSFNGVPVDFKSTKTGTYTTNRNFDKYKKQLSIYRNIADEITADYGLIEHIFTDFNRNLAKSVPNYPPMPVWEVRVPLMSEPETDQFIQNKLKDIENSMGLPEPELPLCTKEELWQGEPEYKYYSSAQSKRSSKNFTNKREAYLHRDLKGKGFIKEIPAVPKACEWCPAAPLCSQHTRFVVSGVFKKR